MEVFWGVLILTQLVSGPAAQPEYIVEEYPMLTEAACERATIMAADVIDQAIADSLAQGLDVIKEGYAYTLVCEARQ